jgi:hypothetical protein
MQDDGTHSGSVNSFSICIGSLGVMDFSEDLHDGIVTPKVALFAAIQSA